MYGPSLCARFLHQREDGVEISMFTSGCPFEDVKEDPYKIWRIPVLLRIRALPLPQILPASDPRIRYQGLWFPWATTAAGDPGTAPRATLSRGATAEITFTGTGIEYLADKSAAQGRATILLDGAFAGTASLQVNDFPILLGVSVYHNHHLTSGPHTLRIVNEGAGTINLAGFRVYS